MRPQMPENTPKEITDIAIECWNEDANKRPTFAQISQKLVDLTQLASETKMIKAQALNKV